MNNKQKKIFKIVIIALILFLIGEVVYFGIKYYNDRKNSVYYTVINSAILEDNDNYVGVGFSDYRNSKLNKYEKGYYKATISNYKDGKLLDEVGFKTGYNSYFNDVIKVKDGYIAVGQVEMTKEQHDDGLSEGLIIKYDNNFKQVWRKNISVIGKTEFYKIKQDEDDYVVVGSSVYGNGYMGNHTTGGGIILKISKDGEELDRANNGGPYSGKFNDVLVEDDGYVVVGLGKSNSGIIIKYNKELKKEWSNSYGYTDKNGITRIEKLDDDYITSTTKLVSPKDTSNVSAALVLFNSDGKKLDDVKYTKDKINVFQDLAVKDDQVFVSGYTGTKTDNSVKTDAIIVKYDKDLYEEESKVLKEKNNEYFIKLYLKSKKVYVLGYTNSKIKEYKTNGYDYFPIINTYNYDLK